MPLSTALHVGSDSPDAYLGRPSTLCLASRRHSATIRTEGNSSLALYIDLTDDRLEEDGQRNQIWGF